MLKNALVHRLAVMLLIVGLAWPDLHVVQAENSPVDQLQDVNQSELIVRTHPETGMVTAMRMPDADIEVPQLRRLAGADVGTVAQSFLASYGTAFGLTQQDDSIREIQRVRGTSGTTFLKYQQQYKGIPVMAGELIVAVTAQRRIRSVHAEILPMVTESLDTVAKVSRATAQQTARTLMQRSQGRSTGNLTVSDPELWIVNPKLLGGPLVPRTTLNWRMEVTGMTASGPVRELVLVNAHTGAVTLHFSQIAHALNQRICDNQSKEDKDWNSSNNCTSDKKAVRTNSPTDTGNADVDIAWEFTKATYDFYQEVLNRDSIDGNGMQLISLVNYCEPNVPAWGYVGCPYQNAFWNGFMMTYGSGFANADDVVAHELTHGVTEYTAGLFYYYQSGAINEALSDIFGELIDRAHDGRSVDTGDTPWLMGEDLSIGAIRDMQDPPVYEQPDKMSSSYYTADVTMNDSGGVHTNSGVANKAAYLLIAGDTFNGKTVTSIGDTKTAALFYGAMTQYLTSGSDYADLADALVAVCAGYVLDASYSFASGDCTQVENAILATEMRDSPTAAPAPDAAICTGGNVPLVSWAENFNNVKFPAWKTAPAKTWVPFYGYAPDGSLVAYGPSQIKAGSTTLQLKSPIYIPDHSYLHFEHYYLFEYDADGYYDGGVIEYSTDGKTWTDAGSLIDTNGYTQQIVFGTGNPIGGYNAFAGPSNGYVSTRLDVSSLAGQSVYWRFRVASDAAIAFDGWRIDNLQLYSCVDPDTYAVQLSGSGDHTCAMTLGDNVLCWGKGDSGQIGNGASSNATKATFVVDSSDVRVEVEPFGRMDSGAAFSCTLSPNAQVQCWGDNASGQLGNNTYVDSNKAVTVLVDATTPLNQVFGLATGAQHACAIGGDWMVYCWGANGSGQLGNGTEVDQNVAVLVEKADGSPLRYANQVVAGADHSCALINDGSVWCWGDNGTGELGVGATPLKSAVAVPVKASAKKNLTGIRDIAVGADTTCAITTKSALLCWGRNSEGQLGNGTYTNALFPTAPKIGKKAFTAVSQIFMGLGSHMCASSTNAKVYCWGANANGQLGLNTTDAKNSPTALNATVQNTLVYVMGMSVGMTHTCALNNQLAVYCWGDNSVGQLGDGAGVASSLLPVRVKDTNNTELGSP